MVPDSPYLVSLAVYTFGALAFSVLTVFYWSQQRHRRTPGRSAVLPVFTLVCAVAFLDSLLDQSAVLQGPALVLIRNLAAGLLPPLVLHLVAEFVWRCQPGVFWRPFLISFYTVGVASTALRGLIETGLLAMPGAGALYFAPAVLLASGAFLGILLLAISGRSFTPIERAHRRALLIVLVPSLACALANLSQPGPFVRQMPDYLVLAFFCVTLYFRERLAFIDLLAKRGTFFAAGLVLVFGSLAIRRPTGYTATALVLALWLAAPPVYGRIDRLIDSIWWRRPYSPADAERRFIWEIQSASTAEEVRASAARALDAIFRASADVRFEEPLLPKCEDPEDGSLAAALEWGGSRRLSIVLAPRADGIPFLSDDRRLLELLAGTLGVVLENVHFREDRRRQEAREQQLRWLAGRAELKALRAQINPHFLFNALSVITGLIQYRPELAAETVEELAHVFRYALRKSDSEWAALAEEVEFVAAYLRIEQARFGGRLKFELDVDPAAGRVGIPAMSIQPLVENAIRHGISGKESGGTVAVHAELQGGVVSIEVFDNGPGFPPGFSLQQYGEGHGLRNVAERLRGYYGDAGQLSWESGPDGTCVVLTFPQSPMLRPVADAPCAAAGGASDSRSDC